MSDSRVSKEANDGGPAFPSHGTMGEVAYQGMTLRDYFAAKALPATLGDPQWGGSAENAATWAYIYAEAMLAERAK